MAWHASVLGSIMTATVVFTAPGGAEEPDSFAHPSNASRMLRIVHGWPADSTGQDNIISAIQEEGFGGAVTNVSFDADYTGNETNWSVLTSALAKMKAAGLETWLYDEAGYPSGRAGTLVLEGHPELEACGLFTSSKLAEADPIELKLPPGEIMVCHALPMRNGLAVLSEQFSIKGAVRDGVLTWRSPDGAPHMVVIATMGRLYENTQVSTSGVPERTPYTNLLLPETTQRFLELTHDRYAERLGKDLGAIFRSVFTDEPSLLSAFFAPMPYGVLPWGANLPGEFEKRRGYALAPVLPALIVDAGPEGKKARYDFWRTVGEVFVASYFAPIQEWCEQHNIPSGGHLLLEENILDHVAFYGDFMQCLRALDVPGVDCLTGDPTVPRYRSMIGMGADVPWNASRLASSAAELNGGSLVMSETTDFLQMMNPKIGPVSEVYFRGVVNRQLLGGINRFNTYGQFKGMAPEELKRLNLWIGRSCEALTGGIRKADIAVLYPIETAWTRFTPSAHWVEHTSPAAQQIEHVSRDVADALFEARREFGYIDTRTLAEAKAANGALSFRGAQWRVLILPCVDTLPANALDNLLRFWESGGIIISVAALPENTDLAFPSGPAREAAHRLFAAGDDARIVMGPQGALGAWLPADGVNKLPGLLDILLPTPLIIEGEATPIRVAHRIIGDEETLFISNDNNAPWQGRVSLATGGPAVLMQPATGETSRITDISQPVSINVDAYDGVFLRFPTEPRAARLSLDSQRLTTLGMRQAAG